MSYTILQRGLQTFSWEIMCPAKNWGSLNLRKLGKITTGGELVVFARLWEGYYLINHKPWCEYDYQLLFESEASKVRKTSQHMRTPGRGEWSLLNGVDRGY